MAFVGSGQDEWWKQLEEAGVTPPEGRRGIIDISIDDAAKVYYECFADKRMFSIDLIKMVSGTKAINVMEQPD